MAEKYVEIICSAHQGNYWSFQKYKGHIYCIKTTFVSTICDYWVATGWIYESACFKTLAGELISGPISGNHVKGEEVGNVQTNQQKKVQ